MAEIKVPHSFKGKRVLVAGGTGMVGTQLTLLLLKAGARVYIASLDDQKRALPGIEKFHQLDLTNMQNCRLVCNGMDYVFNLLGTKGSPAVTSKYPLKFFESMSAYNYNLLRAAFDERVGGYLLTSTVGVYPPAEVFKEKNALTAMPSPNDFFAGLAKIHAETHVRAYIAEAKWNNITIVRPANIYGPHDNFDGINAMVIPSLIKRAISGENPFIVWGDGTSVRDFIHSSDVARGMLYFAEHGAGKEINLASGIGITIRELVELVVSNITSRPEVVFDASKPSGDAKRVLDTTLAQSLGFKPVISMADGIRQTMAWYAKNKNEGKLRYDVFNS